MLNAPKRIEKNYPKKPGLKINPGLVLIGFRTVVAQKVASHAGVFRRARTSFIPPHNERRAPLKMPAWEATQKADNNISTG